MKRILLRLSVIVVLGFFIPPCFSQQIDSMLSVYDEQFPKERIHIQFDKPAYNKEETIWYKVYVLAGSDLTSLSKNVYVEWYDTTGKMIRQTVAPLFQSSAKGSFELPADYSGNFIHVKAYTRWMLNDDPAFAYGRELVINTPAAPANKKPVMATRTKVETFPEGGFLIQGLTSRVAFKATNQFGTPVLIKGILQNDKNKTLDTLKVQHDGMGMFTLAPQPGETYRLSWTDENGRTGTTQVPVTKTEGACMTVTATNDKALVQVERSKNVGDNFRQLFLLVHLNQKLFFKATIKSGEKLLQNAVIPIDELPTGILQFSLFTSDWIPVAERILFVNNHQHEFNAKINTQLVSLDKRG
ncbi:MAG: hypothetical protein JWQ78_1458, partial [Sediminibacterium sp.]|nr:hypothetical protein [Sediminibacterium sp.]